MVVLHPNDGMLHRQILEDACETKDVKNYRSHDAIKKVQDRVKHIAPSWRILVAAELYRRGYSVAMTLGNAKSIDLFANTGLER